MCHIKDCHVGSCSMSVGYRNSLRRYEYTEPFSVPYKVLQGFEDAAGFFTRLCKVARIKQVSVSGTTRFRGLDRVLYQKVKGFEETAGLCTR